MQINSPRVVITGLGGVTPLGNTVDSFWENLCAGCSGVGPITRFDAAEFHTRIAAEVRNLTLPDSLSQRQASRLDRFAIFALTAASEAWRDSGLHSFDPYEIGVLIGSSHGGEESLLNGVLEALTGRVDLVSPRLIPRMLGNMASAQVAIHFGLHGPNFTVGSACATGAHAIGEAAEIIRRGDANVMLCGGAEACITPLTLAGDQASKALSRRNNPPESASRPFDQDRDGFVLGEGAGISLLESDDYAIQRGARIYAEILGYGLSSDALHETRPNPSGGANAWAIRRSLQKANLTSAQVSAIFAHATGTLLGDRAEAQAMIAALGETASQVPLTAIKGSLGHLLGAAGAVQAIAVIKALQTQTLPPTLNLEKLDPACPLNIVTKTAKQTTLTHILSNACGFGGQNAALIFGIWDMLNL